MSDALQLALATALLLVPGAGLSLLCGVRSRSLVLGAAPAVTMGVVALTAMVGGLTGLRFGPPLLLAVLVALAAGVLVVRAAVARRRRQGGPLRGEAARPSPAAAEDAPLHPRGAHDPGRVTALLGWALTAVAGAAALSTWRTGLGSLASVPQEHDTIHHTAVVAWIWRSGRAAPWEVFPADVVTGEPVGFYPAGSQAFAALLAPLTGDPVAGLNAMSVVVLVVGLLLGVHALARRLPSRWAPLVAGFAALLAATSYRPTFAFLHDGGILANACAAALAPGLTALVVSAPRLRWTAVVPVALGAAGALTVHPTAAPVVAGSVLAWWAGQLLTRRDRASAAWTRRSLPPLAVVGALVVALALPTLAAAASVGGEVTGWPRDMPVLDLGEALPIALGHPYGGFLDPDFEREQRTLTVLVAVGAVVLLALRRGWGALVALLASGAVLLLYLVAPDVPGLRTWTGLFYNSYVRIQAAGAAWSWVVGGVALALPAGLLGLLATRRAGNRVVVGAVVTVVTALTAVGFWTQAGSAYARTDEQALASRYASPDFVRVGPDDRRAIDFLAGAVQPGERVLNNANDGSTYAYVYAGVPVVNFTPLGESELPYAWGLLERIDDLDTDPQVQRWVCEEDVAWVYVDEQAPGIGSPSTPGDWYPEPSYTVPPAFLGLDDVEALEPVMTAGTVTVYQVDEALLAPCSG